MGRNCLIASEAQGRTTCFYQIPTETTSCWSRATYSSEERTTLRATTNFRDNHTLEINNVVHNFFSRVMTIPVRLSHSLSQHTINM
jgi:hypothetical protein